MTKSRRNQKVITKDILEVIQNKGGSARTTHLIHKSNLSSTTFKTYITRLKKSQLVRELQINNHRHFEITERGFKWISTST
jgi:predicted transcriptional regulator